MLAQRPAHKFPSPASSGHRSALSGPASTLERNPLSPTKGWAKRDSDGVGLSIVPKLKTFTEKGSPADAGEFPVADFLSFCFLCRKKLEGKDIYMYRGEKAFCSMQCRYEQIVTDEFLNKKGSLKF